MGQSMHWLAVFCRPQNDSRLPPQEPGLRAKVDILPILVDT